MNKLAPTSRPASPNRDTNSGGTENTCIAPAPVRTVGRGRSVGSSNGSNPANCPRQ
ncbi:hypothetical protein SNL152K_10645 [Streptomyces sp. NL15-2K]|nr:hypothetical protein SNL152K_10645 [Streptomyces sp. NL15-2K]